MSYNQSSASCCLDIKHHRTLFNVLVPKYLHRAAAPPDERRSSSTPRRKTARAKRIHTHISGLLFADGEGCRARLSSRPTVWVVFCVDLCVSPL